MTVIPSEARDLQLTGLEWMVDARGCDPERLTGAERLAALFDEIIADLDLHVVGTPVWHTFPGHGGVTGMAMLSESHLTVHTFPEHGSLCLNLFCCRPRRDLDWSALMTKHIDASEVEVRRAERNYCHPERSEGSAVPGLQIPRFARNDPLTRT